MHRTHKYLQHSSITCPVWLNRWVLIYRLSCCGFESRCCLLIPNVQELNLFYQIYCFILFIYFFFFHFMKFIPWLNLNWIYLIYLICDIDIRYITLVHLPSVSLFPNLQKIFQFTYFSSKKTTPPSHSNSYYWFSVSLRTSDILQCYHYSVPFIILILFYQKLV